MKVKLVFEESDFQNMRVFEKAVQKQLGNNVYVGTNSLSLYFEFPKEMAAMLRPFPEKKVFEFELESSKPDAK